MGKCDAQVFSGIEPEHFASLIGKAKNAGIPLEGNSGTAAKMGVEVEWNYVPESGVLSIQCTRVPFFLSCNDITNRIQELVKESVL